MLRILAILLTGILVNAYWFPVSFHFAPDLNFKKILAVAGLVILALQILNRRSYEVPKSIFGAVLIATAYSVVNLIAVEVNDTFDFTYANYVSTLFVWLFGGYTVMETIRWTHGKTTINLLTSYSTAVAAFQCVIAIAIDRFEVVTDFVSSSFYIFEQDFYEEVNRLYGIGAALDPAGTRFAIILVMIAFVTILDERVKNSTKSILWYLLGFFIISSIGNIISRTTTVGMSLAFMVWIADTGLYRLQISGKSINFFKVLGPVLVIGISLVSYLYQTDEYTYGLLRYGFEGFFNWIEKGEWTTASTEVLETMWQWPTTTKGWIIGTGYFQGWLYGTDIGYCRLILYSGIIGFSTFALLFVYNAYVFISKYRRYRYMFLIFLAMSFIIWYKVSTDLFMVYGLFYAFDDVDEMGYVPKMSF